MPFPLDEFLVKLLIILVGFPVHEAAHATMALWLGDDTAKHLGRVSLNPLKHLDPLGTIMLLLPGSFIGWAKPTPYNPQRIRGSRSAGEALISVAGPLSNLLMATLVALAYRLAGGRPLGSLRGLDGAAPGERCALLFITFNLALFLFNLIPLPPLDGFGAVSQIAAGGMKRWLRKLNARAGFLILFAVLIADDLSGLQLVNRAIGDGVRYLLVMLVGG